MFFSSKNQLSLIIVNSQDVTDSQHLTRLLAALNINIEIYTNYKRALRTLKKGKLNPILRFEKWTYDPRLIFEKNNLLISVHYRHREFHRIEIYDAEAILSNSNKEISIKELVLHDMLTETEADEFSRIECLIEDHFLSDCQHLPERIRDLSIFLFGMSMGKNDLYNMSVGLFVDFLMREYEIDKMEQHELIILFNKIHEPAKNMYIKTDPSIRIINYFTPNGKDPNLEFFRLRKKFISEVIPNINIQ